MQDALDRQGVQLAHILNALRTSGPDSQAQQTLLAVPQSCSAVPASLPAVDQGLSSAPEQLENQKPSTPPSPSAPLQAFPQWGVSSNFLPAMSLRSAVAFNARGGFLADAERGAAATRDYDKEVSLSCRPPSPTASSAAFAAAVKSKRTTRGEGAEGEAATAAAAALGLKIPLLSRLRESLPTWPTAVRPGGGEGGGSRGDGGSIVGI